MSVVRERIESNSKLESKSSEERTVGRRAWLATVSIELCGVSTCALDLSLQTM